MSIHFAPQWVKPIKPTGSAITPSAEAPPQQQHSRSAGLPTPPAPAPHPTQPTQPFPALGQQRAVSPTAVHALGSAVQPAAPNQPLSYSRVTHTSTSPVRGLDGYPPNADGVNGAADPSPFPFRYSRDQILAVWDEEKFKDRPIELMQIADTDTGAVLVSANISKPVGLRDLSELEKRLLSTSVHPPMSNRRQQQQQQQHGQSDQQQGGGGAGGRRTQSATGKERDPTATGQQPNGRAGFGGFGRGEGGAFGAAKFSGALAEGRQPGALGGGFAGVGKRNPRREVDDSSRPSAAATWRPTRSAAAGAFEGVLGFGNANNPVPASQSDATGPEASNSKPEDDRWTSQRKWRAAQDDKLAPAVTEQTDSMIPSASGTPVAERDATLLTSRPTSRAPSVAPQEREDLGNIDWYYRDPNGQEQGPFSGSQMHEWYSHSYFKDDLPLRRKSETSFHTLAELKTATGSAVQPFLTPVRPRLPPNLPIPLAALQASGAVAAPGPQPSPGINDSFRNLNIGASIPQPGPYPQPGPFSAQYGQFNHPAPAYLGGQQGWGAVPQSPARMNGAYGSIGPGSAFPYNTAIGSPVRPSDPFTGAPIGHAASPWGSPAQIAPAMTWPQQPQQMNMAPGPIRGPVSAPQPAPELAPVATPDSFAQPQPVEQQLAAHVVPSPTAVTEEIEPEQEPEAIDDEPEEIYDSEPEMDAVEAVLENEDYEDDDYEEDEESEVAPVSPVKRASSVSAWGKVQAPKAVPLDVQAPTPAQTAQLPPAPASLPAKPAAAAAAAAAAAVAEIAPSTPVKQVTPAEKATPKPAPWAEKRATPAGPSLREIQEAEARRAEARKQALAEARAASSSPSVVSASDDLPASISWGLPKQGSAGKTAEATVQSPATPSAPAWGGASDGPKKTLKQIQEEEEKRKAKQDAHVRAAAAAAGATVQPAKRGYADLAANSAAAAAAAAQGWTTVGSGGKATAAPPKAAAPAPKPVAAVVKPAAAPVAKPRAPVAPKANGAILDDQPSVEFIRWVKQALTGLTVPVDEFVQMLLQFPVDPPAASRNDVLEIIADSVYASSRTLDGRRFASEFVTKRKADAQRARTAGAGPKVSSLADVVKTQPKTPAADAGFKVVKTKKGKKSGF